MLDELRKQTGPLGVFDSGVGGLSVLKELRQRLPHEDILYFADSGHCPYGPRPVEQIQSLTQAAASFLLEQGAKALVIACNTASTAAVASLRLIWPQVPIVGMVPAVKPAASLTRSDVIGVLATASTGRAPVLREVIDRFASDTKVLIAAPPGLVEAVEQGQTETPATIAILQKALAPMLEEGADALVLGCTHFPFLRPALQRLVGDQMRLIDSGDGVARQTERVLTAAGLLNPQTALGSFIFYTTGDLTQARRVVPTLLGLAPGAALDLRPAPPSRL